MRATSDRQQPGPASALPLWWSREFDGEPSMVGKARSWIAGLIPPSDPLDDLLAIASELAGNAIEHTRSGDPGGRFTIDLSWSDDVARLSVGDRGSGKVPVLTPKTAQQVEDDETGRGLLVVDALSTAWGATGDASAHWIWADVRWPADSSVKGH